MNKIQLTEEFQTNRGRLLLKSIGSDTVTVEASGREHIETTDDYTIKIGKNYGRYIPSIGRIAFTQKKGNLSIVFDDGVRGIPTHEMASNTEKSLPSFVLKIIQDAYLSDRGDVETERNRRIVTSRIEDARKKLPKHAAYSDYDNNQRINRTLDILKNHGFVEAMKQLQQLIKNEQNDQPDNRL